MIPVTFLPLYTNHFSRTMALIGFPGSIHEERPSLSANHRSKKRLTDIDPYARYYSIVQSSGMSKSHLLDELSKSRFMIPLICSKEALQVCILAASFKACQTCLIGFPSSDSDVLDFLEEEIWRQGFVSTTKFPSYIFVKDDRGYQQIGNMATGIRV